MPNPNPLHLPMSLLALALSAGCVASGAPFADVAAPEGKAVIYVYRPDATIASARDIDVICYDTHGASGPGAIENGAYGYALVAPGKVECTTDTAKRVAAVFSAVGVDTNKARSTVIDAKPGQAYFIQTGWDGVGSYPVLQEVTPARGKAEIRECKLPESSASSGSPD